MSETTFNQRTADLAAIWRDNRWLYLLAGFALGLLALPAAQMVNSETFALLTGLVPEAVGITFTVLIVERLARSRAERELKEQLIFELGSEDNSTARRALRLLKHRGWDKDGSLRGANLREADLTGAKMRGAELQGAILVNASLKDAELVGANLIGATLDNANLEEADMGGTNLEMASLCRANMHGASLLHSNLRGASMSMSILEKANLMFANLQGTDLREANLASANMRQVNLVGAQLLWANLADTHLLWPKLDESTMLPYPLEIGTAEGDDTNYRTHWTPDTDMTRYTDPNHPDFWQPEWAKDRDGDEVES